jgi:hypothetical protein
MLMTLATPPLPRIDDVDTLARSLVASAPDAGAMWLEQLGPVYDTGGVAKILGGGQPAQEPLFIIVKFLYNNKSHVL